MSSFVWMKFLESSPARYDRGIAMLSGGRIGAIYDRIAALAAGPGRRVLDVGCGTGGLSRACAARGADVTGIDINAGMLEIARAKGAPAAGQIRYEQRAAAEIEDGFPQRSFDAAVSCLVFSEMSGAEQDYTLQTMYSRLRPGGSVVIADECRPEATLARVLAALRRAPLVAVTWLLTQTSTRPVEGVTDRLAAAGFGALREERLFGGTFQIVSGKAPGGMVGAAGRDREKGGAI